ncbi:MAG: hypothetical protein K0V04_07830 [Deltaproteobacteria bacterium]|nr:hypothetical protein [Deltaproteobacteria bacterium]
MNAPPSRHCPSPVRRFSRHTLGLVLGLLIASVAGWASAHVSAAHPMPTSPHTLPGLGSHPAKTQTLVITGGNLELSALSNALGKSATVTKVGAHIRVKGVGAGHLAVVIHSLEGGPGASLSPLGTPGRAKDLTPSDLTNLRAINEGLVQYGLTRNFGQGFTGNGDGEQSQVQRAVYPVPLCTKMQCDDCGSPPEGGLDCSDLKRKRDDALDVLAEREAKVAVWQAALQAHKDMAFYGGVAGMIGDMVSAATTVLSAGTATAAGRAGARLLIQMARDGALEALMAELGIPGLADMTEAMVQSQLAKAEAARVAAAKAYEQAHKAWVDCMNNPAAMSPAELNTYQTALSDWNSCRYNVYFGRAPECALVEFPCP